VTPSLRASCARHSRGERPGALGLGEALDEFGLERIVLGDETLGEAEVVDAGGVADGHGEAGVLEGQAHGEVISTGRLADDLERTGQLLKLGDELTMAFFRVGKLPAATLAGDDEGVFGDIHSEVACGDRHRLRLFLGFTSSAEARMPGIRLWQLFEFSNLRSSDRSC
jgi:hypothetical protein